MDVKLMEIVPKLNENVVFYPFDNTTYLIQQNEFGHQLRISDLNYQLLLLVDGERNLQEIQVKLFQLSSINVPLNLIHEILFIDFSKWGVIHSDVIINERNKDGYLTLKFTLLNVNFLKKIVPYLAFLFNPVFFWSALVVMIFSLSLIFCFSNINLVNLDILNSYDFIYVYIIMAFSVLLHEIGHIAACHYFGVNYGSIGFGFYLFMPVCFADVTDSWKVPTSNRLIIDFGGIFVDLMFLSISLLLYYFFNFKLLLFTSIFIGINVLFNLNPFFRFDGYWALVDFSGIPNLRHKAMSYFRSIFFLKNTFKKTPSFIFLFFYGGLAWFFLIAFFVNFIFFQPNLLIYFPIEIIILFRTIFIDQGGLSILVIQSHLFKIFLPIIFYITLWNALKKPFVSFKQILLKSIQ